MEEVFLKKMRRKYRKWILYQTLHYIAFGIFIFFLGVSIFLGLAAFIIVLLSGIIVITYIVFTKDMAESDYKRYMSLCGEYAEHAESLYIRSLSRKNPNIIKEHKIQNKNDEVIGNCMVCKLSIYSREKQINCPLCNAPAHKPHLLEWAKIKGFCPNCGATLKARHFLLVGNHYDLNNIQAGIDCKTD